ncbi:MAG: BatA domain-containing protein [Deltaproteobacteria bacterium]|nr:BatA domain-containing protein [Deltaproteobacteria bacterium]MCW5804569.1 BatA domain-containing protein [Deltaproteobacteria bacterium]
MGFLAPLMLVGVAALLVPIAIHLIGRQRARVVKFAALDFLMATKRRTARKFRLRERLLLLVRAIACAAIAIALAKPYTSCETKGPQVTRGPQAVVLVLDDSFASSYVVDGKPWIRRAGEEARRILTQLGPEAEVAIIRAAEGADHPTELTRDHIRLRDQLLALEPAARPADTTRALSRAAQLLASSSHARKTVYLIGLVARTGIRDEQVWGEDGPRLVVVDARPASMPNVAVTNLRVDPESGIGTRGVAFDAEIANFDDAATSVEATLQIADKVVARGRVDLAARQRKSKRFVATLPPNVRSTDASVSISGDSLAIDDRRFVRASLRDKVRVLLVDGDPRTVRREDELFYLEAALRPGDRDDSGTQVRSITAEELAGIEPGAKGKPGAIDLAEFDVVVLANVPALSAERVAVLAAWVQSGGGILVAPGDRVDPAAYDRTMLPLLPQSLRDPIDTTWGATPDERDSRALHLVKWEADHPIFTPFPPSAPDLADARFYKIVLLGPTTNTSERKVLARFTNGAAALVEASIGTGKTLLFTSTLDRDWNDLPIHRGFLPLVQQSARHLARKHSALGVADHLVGSSVALPTGDLQKLEVRGPDNLGAAYEGDRIAGRSSIRFNRTDRPGLYRVIGSDQTGATLERDELAFVVNVDPRGSDLAPAPASMLPTSGTGGGTAPESTERRVELWHALAAALLLLLLAEGILVQR